MKFIDNIILNFEKFFHSPKSSQYIIFIIAIIISCFLVGVTGWNTSSKLWVRSIGVFIFVFIDLLAQYCLSIGKYYNSINSKWKYLYFIIFGIYVTIFNIPSAVAFFTSEMQTKTEIMITDNSKKDQLKLQLAQLSIQISNQNNFIAKETSTGYGKLSDSLNSNLSILLERQDKLTTELYGSINQTIVKEDGYFSTLSKALFHIPEDLIKVIMYYVAMGLLIFAMVITCPSFPLKIENIENKKKYENVNKSDLLSFIDAAVRSGSNALDGYAKIKIKTGFSERKCLFLRKFLNNFIVNGQPSIKSRHGGSTLNCDIETLKMEINKL